MAYAGTRGRDCGLGFSGRSSQHSLCRPAHLFRLRITRKSVQSTGYESVLPINEAMAWVYVEDNDVYHRWYSSDTGNVSS